MSRIFHILITIAHIIDFSLLFFIFYFVHVRASISRGPWYKQVQEKMIVSGSPRCHWFWNLENISSLFLFKIIHRAGIFPSVLKTFCLKAYRAPKLEMRKRKYLMSWSVSVLVFVKATIKRTSVLLSYQVPSQTGFHEAAWSNVWSLLWNSCWRCYCSHLLSAGKAPALHRIIWVCIQMVLEKS